MCPYYLDGDQVLRRLRALPDSLRRQGEALSPARENPVIPVFSRRLSMAADVASVQFSRTVERLITPSGLVYFGRALDGTSTREPEDAGLSKLNSMLGSLCGLRRSASQVDREPGGRRPSSQVRSTC